MSEDWEARFRGSAKPPGETEIGRCDNAVSAIRNAVNASEKLRVRAVSVFAHGSYRNNTNVRADSDVDIGILCRDTIFFDLPQGRTPEDFGITAATYEYERFKNEVEEALVEHFGRDAVKRGNTAFDLHATSYHVEADVAAFFEYRRYQPDRTWLTGVELRTDKEKRRVVNWPEQHYENGVRKNDSTRTRFKSMVRVLKALSNEMAEAGVRAGKIPGFLIECLVWNVPNDHFGHSTYTADLRSAVVFLYENTKTDDACREWGEVSELKYLFGPWQRWTKNQANDFIVATWNYVGFGG